MKLNLCPFSKRVKSLKFRTVWFSMTLGDNILASVQVNVVPGKNVELPSVIAVMGTGSHVKLNRCIGPCLQKYCPVF